MTSESPSFSNRRRALLVGALLASAGVAAAIVWFASRPWRPSADPSGPKTPAAESPFAAWKRVRDAFLAAPPPRIATEILEQDGTSSWSTAAEFTFAREGAIVSRRPLGAGGSAVEATFAAKKVVYSDGTPKEVALVEPLASWILPVWLDYGTGGVLASAFEKRTDVESRLRSSTGAIGPFVPQRVAPSPDGGFVVDAVIVMPRRRLEVTITFGSDGRPIRRTMRDPTPPKQSSSLERYTYP